MDSRSALTHEKNEMRKLFAQGLGIGDVMARYPDVDGRIVSGVYAKFNQDSGRSGPSAFGVFESDVQRFISRNPSALGEGLKLFDPARPVEYPTDAGPVDILLEDFSGAIVVVEVRPVLSDAIVGQTLRHMGALKEKLARPVHGIIVAAREDDKVRLAVSCVQNLKLVYYRATYSFVNA